MNLHIQSSLVFSEHKGFPTKNISTHAYWFHIVNNEQLAGAWHLGSIKC